MPLPQCYPVISDILSHGSNGEDRRIKCLLEGVEQDAVNICARLLTTTCAFAQPLSF